MRHLSDDELVLYFYDELDDRAAVASHLESCPRCARSWDELQATLALVDRADREALPETDELFGRRMWARVAREIDDAPRGAARWWTPMRLAAFSSIAAALVLAFVTGMIVGRVGERGPATEPPTERILLFAVGNHLDDSQRLLIELVNTTPSGDPADLGRHRERAAELAGSNRIYRRGASEAGETAVAEVLDELERTLLDIAHIPSEAGREELEQLRRRIERRGILMKIRVLGGAEREQPAGRARATTGDAA